jgi:large subunit ribosomal protein L15
MNLTDVRKAKIPRKKKFPVGRGESSGVGKTSGRGHKGQWARSGTSFRPYFEGGQMSIIRRIPKRGFNNKEFKTRFELVHLSDLSKHFEAGQTVDETSLRAKGLLRRHYLLKLLGDGAIDRKLTIKVHAASASAKEKVAKAGGTIEIVGVPTADGRKAEPEDRQKARSDKAAQAQGPNRAKADLSPEAPDRKGAKGETKAPLAQSKPKTKPDSGKK